MLGESYVLTSNNAEKYKKFEVGDKVDIIEVDKKTNEDYEEMLHHVENERDKLKLLLFDLSISTLKQNDNGDFYSDSNNLYLMDLCKKINEEF